MDSNGYTPTSATSSPLSSSPSTSSHNSSLPPTSTPSVVVVSPCAACKILRRKCVENCVLAPYFPPSEPVKFTTAHRVFGASNIIKFLQELPECQRADAVSSMVYEANARIRDPIYGCAGVICHLQKQVNELQVQLAMTQAEIVNIQCQNANLALIYMNMVQAQQTSSVSEQSFNNSVENSPNILTTNGGFFDDNNVCSLWEPLWT
ncbi:hypothetical protein AQUCO_02700112v1 [Aquilegia coerulea]|uniref:LOB domain-containing protein n=1 Tax=Aquilegia coerulea TaxID=218851 RepID=A0A2G5D577_AQUCA|nr:hypothetical protein AQUCO_02700112v1 [Aquilegia coerulea]